MKTTKLSIPLSQFEEGRHALIARMVEMARAEMAKKGVNPGDWELVHVGYENDEVVFEARGYDT